MTDPRMNDILATAIAREEAAYAFYTELGRTVADAQARETLAFIAEEERRHKAFLVDYRDGKYGDRPMRMADVTYYKIAEYQQEPEIKPDMPPQDVFLVAAHREQRSYAFYTEMASLHPAGPTRDLLLRIANEELRHKEKMEYLFSNVAFGQTSGG